MQSIAAIYQRLSKQQDAASAEPYIEMLTKRGYRWMPIGAEPSLAFRTTPKPVGWNNKMPCEVMQNAFAALYEKVVNARDGETALWELLDRFDPEPQSPAEALRQISKSTKSLLPQGRHPNAAIVCITIAPDSRKINALICDNGVGIEACDFRTTIMSLMSDNKNSNPKMSGTYGVGGSAVTSHLEGMLVTSCPYSDPSIVAFTFHKRIPYGDTESYVYLVDESGTVPSFHRDELDDIITLDELNAQNGISLSQKLATHTVLPVGSGTIVQCLGMPEVSNDRRANYFLLREHGFGNELPIHMIVETSSGKHETSNPRGLRYTLRDQSEKDDAKIRVHIKALPILNGHGTIEVWALDHKNPTAKNDKSPVASMMSKNNDSRPLFITINGQTHVRFPVTSLLKNSGLQELNGRLIIEVNCDSTPARERSAYFTSQREAVRDSFNAEIRRAVQNFLIGQSEDSDLRRYNDEVWQRSLKSSIKNDDEDIRQRLAKLFASNVGSKMFDFAAIGQPPARSTEPQTSGSLTKTYALTDEPEYLKIRTNKVFVGSDNYINVFTDANDKFAPYMSISGLPPWMVVSQDGCIPLSNGRHVFNVTVTSQAQPADIASITVSLDITTLVPNWKELGLRPVLSDKADLIVGEARNRQANDKGKTRSTRTVPNFIPVWDSVITNPSFAADWGIGDMAPERICGHHTFNQGKNTIAIYLNLDFAPLREMLADAGKFGGPSIVQTVKQKYFDAACAQAMQMVNDETDNSDPEQANINAALRDHSNFSMTMGTIALMIPSMLDTFAPSIKKRARNVGDVEAEDAH